MGHSLRQKASRGVLCVIIVYTICLLGAGANHARDLWRDGWLPYRIAPLPMNVYWTSLTVFDPLAVWLLWRRRKAGLILTLTIIISDVAVNSYSVYGLEYRDWFAYGSLQSQTLFLGFVAGTLPFVWARQPS